MHPTEGAGRLYGNSLFRTTKSGAGGQHPTDTVSHEADKAPQEEEEEEEKEDTIKGMLRI